MNIAYWITRYLLASGILFLILFLVDLSKGATTRNEVLLTLAWSLAAGAIFVGSKYWRARKNEACLPCAEGRKPTVKH